MSASDQDPAFQRHSTQLVAVLDAGPGAQDISSFEERPSPRVPERNLSVDHETQLPAFPRHIVQPAAVTSSAFGENVDRLGSIRSILDNYPFSAGLLREILQNSDDAEATAQTFLLDCRMHPSERICHPSIAMTQGPALLAFNNAKFSPKDWVALQNISRSSKSEDTSKIGKFGIGIRSCYHASLTHTVQNNIMINAVDSDGGGARFPVKPETIEPIRDHLQTFEHFLPPNWNGETFDGTVIRLPLRTEPGKIRDKIVSPEEIQQLFQEFIQRELSIAMLFLQHLRSIEFTIIDEEGRVMEMAHCTVELAARLSDGVYKQMARVQSAEEANAKDEEWFVIHRSFAKDDVLQLLSTRAGSPCEKVLKKHKLSAHVGLAFLLNSTRNIEPDIGQLFTFLRLPIKTGFPAHIHSLFSLTPSRQNLRPHGENGIVPGSDDYILIEWNKLLFDVFIPRAWYHLLEIIAIHSPTTHIFSAWPMAKHFTESDSAYWASFPKTLLDIVLENDATVWPVIRQDGFKSLQDIFVACASTSDEVLEALADTGMSVCRPPEHLFCMIEASSEWNHRILTPERASTALRDTFASNLLDAPAQPRMLILQYLLSSNDIRNVVGLPVISTVSGSFVSLAQQGTTPNIHTLLETADIELFRTCDENAIFLDELPPPAVEVFRQQAPHTLNVKWLDTDQVVRYLGLHPTSRRGFEPSQTEPDDAAVAFLAGFWIWIGSWGSRLLLLTKLESEYVLPCVGGLRRANQSEPVFDAAGIDPALSACLCGLGVPFLSTAFGSEAKNVLTKYRFLKLATDMHALLDAMEDFGGFVSDEKAQLLFNHFNQCMVNTSWNSFSERQKTAFGELPIFPIVEYGANASVHRRRAGVSGLAVYGVWTFELLPVLPNAVFVDLNVLDHRLLPLLCESQPHPLSEIEVLGLSIKRLHQQPKNHLARMLQHVAGHKYDLTSRLQQSLRSERYAYSSRGTREAPQTLIDPSSPLHPLYANTRNRLHSLQDEEDRSIADSLAKLGLLDKALSANNITDRIHHIASTARLEDAVKLLNIIYQHGFDCHSLTLDKSVKWLPTQKGTLATAAECRPGRGTTVAEELHLFDKVLELVHRSAMVSPSLRTVLGWDDPIPVDVLLRQFEEVLDHPDGDVYHRVKTLIKELSSRRYLTTAQWSSLRELLENREWVPTSEYTLVESWQAVFSSAFQGICMVAPDLNRMGSLAGETPSAAVTSSAIATLKLAVSLTLSEGQRSQLLIPDDHHHLLPIQDVLFNDVGANSLLLPRNEVCLANSSIDDTLARDLELQRLGLKHVHLQTLGEDMGVTPATIVQKTLAQYAEKQFLPEFLANAQDAGASKLMIILNNYTTVEGNFLSPAMERLHDGPSVMVYNDSEFSASDFEGICKTHIGGKADNPDSIGQFGLGALTMFHITECAVIYSGDKVLFLDPSKSYLPIAGRASLLMPLKDLDRVYPGHTGCLEGLGFFDPLACRVDGTIFFLPLRSSSSTPHGKKTLVSTVYSIDTFQQTVLNDFRGKAGECLLFIKVNGIEAQLRTSAQSSNLLWSLTACRTETTFDGFTEARIWIDSCAHSSKKTSSEWLTMSAVFHASAVPRECRAGAGSKIPRVGLAAPLSDTLQVRSKFFSMLPLAIPTTLPVHINASFRLSPDRRQIRLDSYDNDALFNSWLLEMQIPPLYLALLERIAQERDNTRWWPGTREDVSPPADWDEGGIVITHEDVPTAIMLESFYSKHLPESSRNIFYSMYFDESFGHSDAILFPARSETSIDSPASIPSSVQRIIDVLRPRHVTKPTKPVATHLEKVRLLEVIEPAFVRQLLLPSGGSEVIRGELSKEDLAALLVWLVGAGKQADYLEGLPLLFLQDETWAVFETEGQIFYGSPDSPVFVEEDLFPSGRFVHPDTMPEKLLKVLSSSPLKIVELDAAGLRQLVQERLYGLDPQTTAPWVDRFWTVYPKFPKTDLLTSIETLPLVPNMSATSFKSLIECRESGWLDDDAYGEWLVEYCQDLGIDVIPIKHFPSELQDVLHSREYDLRGTQFSRFLRCVTPIIENAVEIFRNWSPDRQGTFAKWVRAGVRTTTGLHAEYIQAVRKLPVWEARRGWEISLCSANEVTLLPHDISIDTGRFSQNFVTADFGLWYLGKPRQTLPQLYRALTLPRILQEGEDEQIYKNLLTSFLKLTAGDIPTIQVPNASRVMVDCGTLLDRTDFFVAACGSSSDLFLLPSFTSFTSKLNDWGFNWGIKFNLFALCARALQDDNRPDHEKLDRARIVYRTYCETLPICLPSNEEWSSLDDIRFIPRDMQESRQLGSQDIQLPDSIRGLPLLVSPRQVVQTRFHSISWTQRAVVKEQPHARILVAFLEFGTPSVEEVVAHLKELSRSPHGPAILPDLKATYEWLNQKITSAPQSLGPSLRDDAIFLNVNDPETDEWSWSSASQMAFEVEGLKKIRPVRNFLKNYRGFLTAAGVLEAHYPVAVEDGEHVGAEHDQRVLQSLRASLNEQRLHGKFSDILLIPRKEGLGRTREQLHRLDHPSLRGHRNYLAGCAPWFKSVFLGDSLEGVERTADGIICPADYDSAASDSGEDGTLVEGSVEGGEDTTPEGSPSIAQAIPNTMEFVLLPGSRNAIKAVLDYFYTGQPFAREDEATLEDLLQTLELASYLDISSLFVIAQSEMIQRRLVNPETLQKVRRRSRHLDANIVNKWCDDYEKANPKLIDLVSQQ
ncbi:hypothetical protein EST38_g3561 [Candolleomyces aberdarensis]|uniref:BTB domain-containing protein n=1 Tax=Candolleomyces aberdarensis TaxID=2316362 RepID=A0A4V1Q4J5_9AGAR|nr:hypothetical protein EST38_g3561 [Candolleomyces aberdarensis]